jgi:hypothetical protein
MAVHAVKLEYNINNLKSLWGGLPRWASLGYPTQIGPNNDMES